MILGANMSAMMVGLGARRDVLLATGGYRVHGLESTKKNAVDCQLHKTRTIQGCMDDLVVARSAPAVIRRGMHAQLGCSDKIRACNKPALMPEAL